MLGVALSAQVIPLAYAMCGKEATSENRSPEECSKDNDCFIKWDYTVGASPQDCADRYIKTKFYYCTGWINKTCDWSAPQPGSPQLSIEQSKCKLVTFNNCSGS